MTRIKLTKPIGGHEAGETIEVTTGAATYLTQTGYAETTQQTQPRNRKPKKANTTPQRDVR